MIPLSQSLLLSSYPQGARRARRWRCGRSPRWSRRSSGPLLGGWITDNISWPWIFYINIPVGIVAAAVDLDRSTASAKRRRASCRSTASASGLLVIWVGALQIMLDKGKDLDWFGSTQIVVLAVVAVVGLRALPRLGADRATSGRRPAAVRAAQLLDQHASRCRSPTALFFGNVVLLPLWLQQYMGYTATHGRAWCWRRSDCSRSCCRRWSASNVAQGRSARVRDRSHSRSSRSCSSCARTSTPTPTFAR